MTTQNNDVRALKTQVFNLSCELDNVLDAYQSLGYLACAANVDSKNVGSIVMGLNYRLESLLKDLELLYKREDKDS